MSQTLPETSLAVRSRLDADGALVITLESVPVRPPAADEVTIRVEAAPINPADLIPLLAGIDPATAKFGGRAELPQVSAHLPAAALAAQAGRIGRALPVGLEGAGLVIAAGPDAQDLLGQRVAVLSMGEGLYAQHCTVPRHDCAPLPPGITARQGAGLFCNPLTALAMVETLRQTGQTAMVHTAAASSLGQMLVRICAEDGVSLVNIVRRAEQADLLRGLGATHVCDSSLPSFAEDLHAALLATGATVAFDAIGGGTMAHDLLVAMERAAVERTGCYSPFGSTEAKQVHIYGGLDPAPTRLPRRGCGMTWHVSGWAMPPILAKAGPERTAQLMARIVGGITGTFASHYAEEISLAEALGPAAMLDYCRLATGRKFLINPQLDTDLPTPWPTP